MKTQMEKLSELLQEEFYLTDIEDCIIDSLVDDFEDVNEAYQHLSDICAYGCVTGIVPELIYNHDVHDFLKEHAFEIEEIVFDTNREFRSFTEMVWFAYEWYAYEVMSKIDIIIEKLNEEDE